MIKRNVPNRGGRARGRQPRTTAGAQFVIEETHRTPRRKKVSASKRSVVSSMQRVKREALMPKPGTQGAGGLVPLASPSTRRQNLKNASRKPAARGRSPRKALRA